MAFTGDCASGQQLQDMASAPTSWDQRTTMASNKPTKAFDRLRDMVDSGVFDHGPPTPILDKWVARDALEARWKRAGFSAA